MAIAIKQEIQLGLTRVDLGRTQEATLVFETDRAPSGGIKSSATVFWVYNGGRTHAFGLRAGCGDFAETLRKAGNVRATQAALGRQHKDVFTSEVVEQITARAKDWYSAVE